jgi:hypothetical protein
MDQRAFPGRRLAQVHAGDVSAERIYLDTYRCPIFYTTEWSGKDLEPVIFKQALTECCEPTYSLTRP